MSEKTHHVQDITNYYIDSNLKRSTCSSYIPRDYGIDIPVKAFIKKKNIEEHNPGAFETTKGPIWFNRPNKEINTFSNSTEN